MYKYLVFDLDGTLLDTLDDIHASLNASLEALKLPSHKREAVRAMVGNGLASLVHKAVPPSTPKEVEEAVLAHFKQGYMYSPMVHTRPYPGIVDLLVSLKARGHGLGVVTNKHHPIASSLVESFFPGIFDAVQGDEPGIPRKPNPQGLLKVLRVLGGEANEGVFIGDSETDVETAIQGKIPCIAVTWGFRSYEELHRAGARIFAHDTQELYNLVRKE